MNIHIDAETMRQLEDMEDEDVTLVIKDDSEEREPAEGFLDRFSEESTWKEKYDEILDEKEELLETSNQLRVNCRKLEEVCRELQLENRSLRIRNNMVNTAFKDLCLEYNRLEKALQERGLQMEDENDGE